VVGGGLFEVVVNVVDVVVVVVERDVPKPPRNPSAALGTSESRDEEGLPLYAPI
jgi:hypothetical protein